MASRDNSLSTTQKLVYSHYNMNITMKKIYDPQWNIVMGGKGAMWF